MQRLVDGFELDDAASRIDRDALWEFLSTKAYWARWRTRTVVEAQVDSAWRVVGLYQPDGRMVGFARAFSDGAAMAYLADVWVAQGLRGQGFGQAVLKYMIDDGPGSVYRWMLHTADAHGLYAQFGFVSADSTYLERRSSRSSAEG